MAQVSPAPTQFVEKPTPWYALLIYAVICFGVAGYFYSEITTLETSGGVIKIPLWLMLPYKLGGKWGLVGILGTIGAFSLALGVVRAFSARTGKGRVPFAFEDPVWARRLREEAPPSREPGPVRRKR